MMAAKCEYYGVRVHPIGVPDQSAANLSTGALR